MPSGLCSEQPNDSCKESDGGPEVVLSLLSAVAATHSCSCTRTELAWRVAARRYTLRGRAGNPVIGRTGNLSRAKYSSRDIGGTKAIVHG